MTETFFPREQKNIPGVKVRVTNEGVSPLPDVRQGTVVALFRSDWGPLMTPTDVDSIPEAQDTFGTALGADAVEANLRGGALVVRGVRVGTGGTASRVTLADATPTNLVDVVARHVGNRPDADGEEWSLTVRDSLTNAAQREALLYAGASLLQTVTFAKGGGDEAQALVDAINASGSAWLGTAVKLATGTGVLAAVANKPFAGGADPAVVAADYSTAMGLVEASNWNILALDSEDAAVHASVQAYVDRLVDAGKYVLAVVGEPTSVAWATRLANAGSFNDENVVYVGNGFELSDGTVHEGYRAAARVAGVIAGQPYTSSLTNVQIPGAVRVVDELSTTELDDAFNAGMLTFKYSASGKVVVTQGINTLTDPPTNLDLGWRKIRRVRQRRRLIDRCVLATEDLVGKLNNNEVGQAIVLGRLRAVLGQMVSEGALRANPAPTAVVDQSLQATAGPDESYFRMGFVDLDSMEFIFQTFGTQLTAQAA